MNGNKTYFGLTIWAICTLLLGGDVHSEALPWLQDFQTMSLCLAGIGAAHKAEKITKVLKGEDI